jgi:hypothetical protein
VTRQCLTARKEVFVPMRLVIVFVLVTLRVNEYARYENLEPLLK